MKEVKQDKEKKKRELLITLYFLALARRGVKEEK